jgi:predicted lipoprotein with Yx(FWY)xxD motif
MTATWTSNTFDRSRLQMTATFLAAAALAVAAAGCGGGDSGSSTSAASSAPAPHASSDVVSAQQTSLGTVLVDARGRTVYEFAKDKTNKSTCTAGCAANWPYVPAPASLPKSLPGVSGTIATASRGDGTRQLTVAGHPVYTFVGDSAPGQTNGQGVTLNGGLWTVVAPTGAAVTSPAGSASQKPAGPGY